MPRKLNKLPESMPPANDNNGRPYENPLTMPTVLEDTEKIDPSSEDTVKIPGNARKQESLARALELNEKRNKEETLRGERAEADLREQINASGSDRTTGAELSEARKGLDLAKAKKDQDKVIAKAGALGLSQAQFLQMLDNGPLEESEKKSFFGTVANTFRRLAGQPWAGMDAKKLNELMESYRSAEKIVDSANNTALEQAPKSAGRISDRGTRQFSHGGDSAENMTKDMKAMADPETYKMTGKVNAELAKLKAEEEYNPGGTANALLEKYQVKIGKGRTIAKEGKLAYEDQGSEELSVADLVKSQTLLSEAYNQVLSKNKKDAKALVDAIAEIRNENNGSALATEDISTGRAVAAGRKQQTVGTGSMSLTGRGAGSSTLDRGLNEQLQSYDTKKAKKELAQEASEAFEVADDAERTEMAKPKIESIRKEYSEREKQIELEAAWLKHFSKADAQKAYALMKPSASAMELKVANGAMVANNYKAMLTEEAVIEAKLKRKAPGATAEQLKALRANLDAVRAFAATVTVELGDEDIEVVSESASPTRGKQSEGRALTRDDMSRLDKLVEDGYVKENEASLAKLDRLAQEFDMREVAELGRKNMEAAAANDRAKAKAAAEAAENEDTVPYARPKPSKVPKLADSLKKKSAKK